METNNIKERLLEIFEDANYLPVGVDKLFDKLGFDSALEFKLLVKALNELEDEYLIGRNKKDEFATLDKLNLARGIIDVKETVIDNKLNKYKNKLLSSLYFSGSICSNTENIFCAAI